jgi:hypothetical protein
VLAQGVKCPKGYQPYADRCVTQQMADYISCVEASGGNRQEISEEVSKFVGKKPPISVNASGSGPILKGSAGIIIGKASEKTLVKKLETKWFPKGMSECTKVLDKRTLQSIRTEIKTSRELMNKRFDDLQAKKPDMPVFNGKIIAANEATPWVPADTFSLMLGDDLQVLTRSTENFIFSKDGKPFLKMKVQGNELFVTASIVDQAGNSIVRIINNEFQASQERAFNPKQPDAHTLIVRDFDGAEVLNIRYVNPKVIRIVGRFRLPGYNEPVLILPVEGIRWPGGGGIGHLTVNMNQSSGGLLAF